MFMPQVSPALDQLCVNAIRVLSIDAVQNANSGHPGLPMGAAPMAYTLWQRYLKHDPDRPDWVDRDRFVLSAGHGSMLLYSLLHLTGYDVSLDDIKNFRQWDSITPGHPEYGMTPGVETTTGPLGQGTANAVGMAIAERWMAHRYNRPDHDIINHFTYALVSDGDLMEGISAEAASLAGQMHLGKLIYLYDANDVTLDGPLDLSFGVENVEARYRAHGWHVLSVGDGDTDLDSIGTAIEDAQAETERPSLILIKTTIGYGSPNKAGTAKAHGSPLGEDEVALARKELGWEVDAPFQVPKEALDHMLTALDRGGAASAEWDGRFKAYRDAHPDLAAELEASIGGDLPDGWADSVPQWDLGEKIATRASGGKALQALAKSVPWLVGGDADLSSSTKTLLDDEADFDGRTGGRNLRFGVREHAMAAIANGMCYHGGTRPFVATFFCFSDYMRPSIRLAALSHLAPVYVWTHDSIGVGEDGPTHQPVEHVMSLRTVPNLHVIRPGDANESAAAWVAALSRQDGPTALVFSRQGLPVTTTPELASELHNGAYIHTEASDGQPHAILIATGSELHLAVEACAKLEADGVPTRVVSMPCWERFEAQDAAYQEKVLPAAVFNRVSAEAGVTLGWQKWVGDRGTAIGIDRFGASAPGDVVQEKFGLTADAIVKAALRQG